jgi:hypothetical protein
MHPLAEARVAHKVPKSSSTTSTPLPATRATSKSGVMAVPRYCQGSRPAATYQVRVAAMMSVTIPAMLPSGMDLEADRHSSAACAVPSIPR